MSAQAETPTIQAESRTLLGHQAKQLRVAGNIPAVLYGHVKSNQNLTLDSRTFTKLYNQIGHTTLANLKVGSDKAVKVLIHDVAVHPTRGEITHVDLLAVNLKEKLTTEVPLEFTGVAPAVDVDGGIFVAVRSEIEIECLPENLPQHLVVDISGLVTFDDSIRAKDIVLPEGVVTTLDPEEVIASITEPISQEELDKLDEVPDATVEFESETTSGTEKASEDADAK